MDADIDLARSAVDDLHRFNMRIELSPRAAPVGTNLLFPDYPAPSEALGQLTLSLIVLLQHRSSAG